MVLRFLSITQAIIAVFFVAQKYDFFRVKKDFLNNFFQPKIKIFLYLCEVREQGAGSSEE